MNCGECKYARKLVNTNRFSQVGCELSLRIESQEEQIIASVGKVVYSMVYINLRPGEGGRSPMKKGLVVDKNFTCRQFKEL